MSLKSFLVLFFSLILILPAETIAQVSGEFQIARAKYRGGGDWYNDPSSLQNLIDFTKKNAPINVSSSYRDVSIGSTEIHSFPFVYLTGHGNIAINSSEARNLREYLQNGGFLFIDDDYGLDEYIRPAMKQVLPDEEFVEIPFDHPIYDQIFHFPDGLPKVHEHDNEAPRGYGIFHEGKLVVFYTVESNLGDGWADPEIHNDPPEIRQKALQMGANILIYALTRD